MTQTKWKIMKFSDFVDINPRIPIVKQKEYTFVEMGIVTPDRRYVSSDSKRVYKGGGAKFQNDDVLFARITPCLENGKIAQFKGKEGEIAFGSTEFFIFRYKEGISDQNFVFYLSYSDLIRKPAEKSMLGASGRQRADLTAIKDLDIFVPSLVIQEKIASILSAYDDLIEINNRRITILEEMAYNIYREWFVNFKFPGYENLKLIKSDMGMIPETWEIKKLSEIVKTQYGYTESAMYDKIGPKFVRGTDINKNAYIQWDLVPYCPIDTENYNKFKLFPGDILVIRMADPGKVGIIERNIDAVFASYLIRLSINSQIIKPYYLFYFLSSDYYQNYITGASTGTTRKSASAKVVTDIKMVIPSKEIIEKFESEIYIIRKLLNNLIEKNYNLRKTRDLLLQKLISGELNVENINIDKNLNIKFEEIEA